MARIIAIANQKGGVGKTTTAINLSTGLTSFCNSVLLLDLDPQANATSGLGFDNKTVDKSIYDVIVNDLPVADAIRATNIDWFDMVSSNVNLIGAEIELVNMLARETKLKNALSDIKDLYDYIFIDCPPSLGLLTINALTCADAIVVPIQCEYYAMEGLSQLLNTINLVRQHLNKNLEIEGVLLTMYDSRVNLGNQVVNEVRKYFGEKVYKTMIPRNVRLAEAPSFGRSILEYDRTSTGAKSYINLAKEFVHKQN